jgi:hypothetical protein
LLNNGEIPGMIPLSDPVNGLEVSRDDLSKAIHIVAGMAKRWNKGVNLRFVDGWLFIEAGHSWGLQKRRRGDAAFFLLVFSRPIVEARDLTMAPLMPL